MRSLSLKLGLLLCAGILSGSVFAQRKPLYKLPEKVSEKTKENPSSPFLLASDTGLFKVLSNGTSIPLWSGGKVSQILRTDVCDQYGVMGPKWYFVTSAGILTSTDLETFTESNNGLPFQVIKEFENGEKKLLNHPHLLKDICADPLDQNVLVTATKDAVFLTRDGGANWKNIGSMSKGTAGMKAVAVAHMRKFGNNGEVIGSELVVFMSHPIYGFSYYMADRQNPKWTDVSAGFAAMPSLTQVDEIADIVPVLCTGSDGESYVEIYLSQTFLPNIYRFDWAGRRAEKVYSGTEQVETIDSLCQSKGKLFFVSVNSIKYLDLATSSVTELSGKDYESWKEKLYASRSPVNSAYIPSHASKLETPLQLNELWLLQSDSAITRWGEKADNRKAIYISAYQVRNNDGIEKYRKIVKDNKLNAVVVDMKDDYGLLRFTPTSEILKKKGYVSQYKIDVENFVSKFKEDNVYLIARIVVFKDRNLANYGKKQYAIWDSSINGPWVGIKGTEEVKDEEGNVTGKKTLYYDENWVDPYCEEVWEYNVEIAKELVERGFDEIQFDYIRFPTDGTNLGKVWYRWRDKGMDKESALVSFLSYARKNIEAPIGIDIYGANGWYRSGTRTGQDVELMSDYVDVICPMFYPSHFEQDFLEYAPVEERPYRIYFYGSYRNTVIGRNHIVVRPWVQAFYLRVRYDRQHYGKDYVRREIFGVRDGLDRGYMHWNNSGGYYDDISPDPADDEISPWHENECDRQQRLPAFSSGNKKKGENSSKTDADLVLKKNRDMISIMDTVLDQGKKDVKEISSSLLRIEPLGVFSHD